MIDPEEVAEMLMICDDVLPRMMLRGVFNRRQEATLPLGTMTCGELIRLTRWAKLLAFASYPEMLNPEVVEALIRSAAVREAGGAVN